MIMDNFHRVVNPQDAPTEASLSPLHFSTGVTRLSFNIHCRIDMCVVHQRESKWAIYFAHCC